MFYEELVSSIRSTFVSELLSLVDTGFLGQCLVFRAICLIQATPGAQKVKFISMEDGKAVFQLVMGAIQELTR